MAAVLSIARGEEDEEEETYQEFKLMMDIFSAIIIFLTLLAQCLWKVWVERLARLRSQSSSAARSPPIETEKAEEEKKKKKGKKGDDAEAPAQGSQGPLRFSPVSMAPDGQRAPVRDQRGDARSAAEDVQRPVQLPLMGTARVASIPKLVWQPVIWRGRISTPVIWRGKLSTTGWTSFSSDHSGRHQSTSAGDCARRSWTLWNCTPRSRKISELWGKPRDFSANLSGVDNQVVVYIIIDVIVDIWRPLKLEWFWSRIGAGFVRPSAWWPGDDRHLVFNSGSMDGGNRIMPITAAHVAIHIESSELVERAKKKERVNSKRSQKRQFESWDGKHLAMFPTAASDLSRLYSCLFSAQTNRCPQRKKGRATARGATETGETQREQFRRACICAVPFIQLRIFKMLIVLLTEELLGKEWNWEEDWKIPRGIWGTLQRNDRPGYESGFMVHLILEPSKCI